MISVLNPSFIAAALLVLIFPVSFLWTLLGAYGFVDAGSFINSFALKGTVGIALLGYYMLKQIKNLKSNVFLREQLFFWLMIVIMLGVIVFSYVWPGEWSKYKRALFGFNIKVWIRYISFFLVGYFVYPIFKTTFVRGTFLCWGLACISVLFVMDWSNFSLSYADTVNKRLWRNYLFWGDCFAVISMFLIGQLRQTFARVALFAVSASILYVLRSRGSLFAFVLAYLIFLLWRQDYRGFAIVSVLGIVTVLVLVSIPSNVNRMTAVLLRPMEDQSYSLRCQMLEHGLRGIKQNPIIGDYGGQLGFRSKDGSIKGGNLGAYVHNYLSLWRQFGAVVFAIFVFYVFKTSRSLVTFRRRGDYRDAGTWACFFFVLIAILTSRSYFVPYFWFFAGYISTQEFKNRLEERLL